MEKRGQNFGIDQTYVQRYQTARSTAEARKSSILKAARPTAVNLAWAVDRVRAAYDRLAEARAIYEELGAIRWLERIDEQSGVIAQA